LTSGLTFLTVLVLFLMGGQVLRAFSFALVVGIVVGTYSSFGIAAPLVVAWNRWRGQGVAAGTGPAAGNKARSSENVPGRLAPASAATPAASRGGPGGPCEAAGPFDGCRQAHGSQGDSQGSQNY